MDIEPLEFGPATLRTWSKSVAQAIRLNKPINGKSILVNDSANGKTIDFSPASPGDGNGGSTTIVNNPPFDPSGLQGQIDAQEITIASQTTSITALTTAVTTLQNRLNNATGSGTCTDEGIEINLSFPE